MSDEECLQLFRRASDPARATIRRHEACCHEVHEPQARSSHHWRCSPRGDHGLFGGARKPDDEAEGSTSSKLLAPQKASLTSAASAETTAKYGITHWKMFRGKQSLVMTGYDAPETYTLMKRRDDRLRAVERGQRADRHPDRRRLELHRSPRLREVPEPLAAAALVGFAGLHHRAGVGCVVSSNSSSTASSARRPARSAASAMTSVLKSAMRCMGGSIVDGAQVLEHQRLQPNATNTTSSCPRRGRRPRRLATTSADSTVGSILSSLRELHAAAFDPRRAAQENLKVEPRRWSSRIPSWKRRVRCSASSPFGDGQLTCRTCPRLRHGQRGCSIEPAVGDRPLRLVPAPGNSCSTSAWRRRLRRQPGGY